MFYKYQTNAGHKEEKNRLVEFVLWLSIVLTLTVFILLSITPHKIYKIETSNHAHL